MARHIEIIDPMTLQDPKHSYGDREFDSDAFYSVLWLLVFMLACIGVSALYGMYKIGHIPPPEKRPTES